MDPVLAIVLRMWKDSNVMQLWPILLYIYSNISVFFNKAILLFITSCSSLCKNIIFLNETRRRIFSFSRHASMGWVLPLRLIYSPGYISLMGVERLNGYPHHRGKSRSKVSMLCWRLNLLFIVNSFCGIHIISYSRMRPTCGSHDEYKITFRIRSR